MSDLDESKRVNLYSFTFSLDRNHFFRRACPACGRQFKTKAEPGDLASLLQPAFKKSGSEVGEKSATERVTGKNQTSGSLYCPYCEHRTGTSDMLTLTFHSYLRRYMMREAILPQIRKMFSELADSSKRHRSRSKGLFSLTVEFKADDSLLPPRPISGPEPPDMTIVELLCCGKQAKILDGWRDLITCPYCGTKLALQ